MVIEIKLGKAYYNDSFFNVRKNFDDKFATHNENIEVQLGNTGRTLKALINRQFNANGTLSIYLGTKYKDWVQANYNLGDQMKVQIVSPNFIILLLKKKTYDSCA